MGELYLGDAAPDFVLPGVRIVNGTAVKQDYRLSDHGGAPIILVFYPQDSSKVCTEQLCSYQDAFGGEDALGAQVWGVSLQGLDSHESFAREKGLTFPLLTDTVDGVAAQYGVMGGKAIRRGVFIIGSDGIILWKHVSTIGFSYRKASDVREEVLRLFPKPAGGSFSLAPPV